MYFYKLYRPFRKYSTILSITPNSFILLISRLRLEITNLFSSSNSSKLITLLGSIS